MDQTTNTEQEQTEVKKPEYTYQALGISDKRNDELANLCKEIVEKIMKEPGDTDEGILLNAVSVIPMTQLEAIYVGSVVGHYSEQMSNPMGQLVRSVGKQVVTLKIQE